MDLYTSLVRLKQGMNGGQLPPMTPVPENVHHLIDPAFTIGLGGWFEEEPRGLRCPVRGCGVFKHNMRIHLDRAHADIGGAPVVLKALDVPRGVPLVSRALRDKWASLGASSQLAQLVRARDPETMEKMAAWGRAGGHVRGAARARNARSTVSRNFRDRCIAQLTHKICHVTTTIGRRPNLREFCAFYGDNIYYDILEAFGSWQNALAHSGIKARSKFSRATLDDVLDSLAAYHKQNGALPTSAEAKRPWRTPLIPCTDTIYRALGQASWRQCMELAASHLNIYGGRYGLPLHLKPKEQEVAA
jgi:hypothetical protein